MCVTALKGPRGCVKTGVDISGVGDGGMDLSQLAGLKASTRRRKLPAPAVQRQHPVSRAATLAVFSLQVRSPGGQKNKMRPTKETC